MNTDTFHRVIIVALLSFLTPIILAILVHLIAIERILERAR